MGRRRSLGFGKRALWNEQQESFKRDWNDDSFVAELEHVIGGHTSEPTIPEVCDHSQTREGSRKRAAERAAEQAPNKKPRTVPQFTIKSVKQVCVY